MKRKKINITSPALPPLTALYPYLKKIWDIRTVTNGGPLEKEFTESLRQYLGVENLCLTSNGTLSLIAAIKALGLKGEIITSPFTSPATVQAICWNGLTPVFADIREENFTISAEEIESCITTKTSAFLPVHVFGMPCDISEIRSLASQRGIPTIYDASHCFRIRCNDKPLCMEGDISTLSLHATKVFGCIEGGAVISKDAELTERIRKLINNRDVLISNHHAYGLNGKLNELMAAIGLSGLRYADENILRRKKAFLLYHQLLGRNENLSLQFIPESTDHNYTYFPVLLRKGINRDNVMNAMEEKGIFTKKYFSPLVSEMPGFSVFKRKELPVAAQIAKQVLCLPLYHDLPVDDMEYITECLTKVLKSASDI